jgi:hypothetical protein
MPRFVSSLTKLVIIIAAALLVVVGYALYYFMFPKTIRVLDGRAGVFEIGETQEALLSRLPEEIFLPEPKPKECPKNWIEVATMTETERSCLLSTDLWVEGIPSNKSVCQRQFDVNTTLEFNGNKLVSVTTVCRHPE